MPNAPATRLAFRVPTQTPSISGYTLAIFALDVGFQIDLDAAQKFVHEPTRLHAVRARRPAPSWFDYSPAPLRLAVGGSSVSIGSYECEQEAELLLYDFGAVLIAYRFPLPASLDKVAGLSVALYQDESLEADARRRIAQVVEAIRPAIERPRISEAFEDYSIFAVTGWDESLQTSEILNQHRVELARIIEAEPGDLSQEQIKRSTEATMSYSTADLAIVDWNAAILFDRQPGDVIAVLQHANIELLELRVLDEELDSILDNADETLGEIINARLWPGFSSGKLLGRFAAVQTDAAVMFEGVNNAIKLLGNQYLARFYRLAAGRLDLPAWQASVKRKLDATESLYAKMSDTTSTRRLELLEWVIIALIAVSIVLPFTPWYH